MSVSLSTQHPYFSPLHPFSVFLLPGTQCPPLVFLSPVYVCPLPVAIFLSFCFALALGIPLSSASFPLLPCSPLLSCLCPWAVLVKVQVDSACEFGRIPFICVSLTLAGRAAEPGGSHQHGNGSNSAWVCNAQCGRVREWVLRHCTIRGQGGLS